MKEQDLEKQSLDLAASLGWHGEKQLGTVGASDKIFKKMGFCFDVEFKVGDNTQDPDQVKYQRLMEANGTNYYIVYTLEEMRDVLIKEEERILCLYTKNAQK